MQVGMIGLGRMGANLTRRLLRAHHECVVYDVHPDLAHQLANDGASAAPSLAELVARLQAPRVVWLMVPARAVGETVAALSHLLTPGDVVIDGGNSHFRDDIRRAIELQRLGLHYVDVGTSGGIWGLERGFCLMIGGEADIVRQLEPIFQALAPGPEAASLTPDRSGQSTADHGYLHCGSSGAGHFVKMVHNGIEYGLMAAYAEGMNLLRHANAGTRRQATDAETAPLEEPELYQYDFDIPEIAEVWRRGSVVRSWLLDLIAQALQRDPYLAQFHGRVADSGEGRWTIRAAIDTGVPTPVLSAALYERFSSRGAGDFGNKLLSALRSEFGGHREQPAHEDGA